MQEQIDISSPVPSPYPPLSPVSNPPHPEYGEPDSKILIKEESGEEYQIVKCRWRECGQVYSDKNQLVEHINTQHIQHKKGCEEYPCYWGVSQAHHQRCHGLHFHIFSLVLGGGNHSMPSTSFSLISEFIQGRNLFAAR